MPTDDVLRQRCWAEIDFDEMERNYRDARRKLQPDTQVIAVVKANAYGYGAVRVARKMRGWGLTRFAVATLSEAEALLRDAPGAWVLVMGPIGPLEIARAVEIGARITIYSAEVARALSASAVARGRIAIAHMKVDTGLHRLGLDPSRPELLDQIASLPGVAVEGLYTHLAVREPDEDRRQIALFRQVLARYGRPVLSHVEDTIGLVSYPDGQFDAVRIGAWFFGVRPFRYTEKREFRVPLRFYARVAQLRTVRAGERVGYDEDHPLDRDSLIATLAVGYSDGYPRKNSVGAVEIRGVRAPIVGLVCMDQMMADVSHIPGVQWGDAATLLGGSIGIDEYAAWSDLNRNDALCRIGLRVPRLYLSGGKVESAADYMGMGDI